MFRFRIPILLALVVVAALAPATSPVVALEYDDIAETGAHRIAIEALEAAGILTGTECDTGGFCPDEPLPRWVMAVWIVRALGEEEPPAVDATVFADVESDVWWAGHVQRLAELGITKGCGVNPALFCPHQPVTRAQMASFLTRAFNLAGLVRALEVEGTSAISVHRHRRQYARPGHQCVGSLEYHYRMCHQPPSVLSRTGQSHELRWRPSWPEP